MTAAEHAYSEAEVAERLAADLAHWRYENGWIRRHSKPIAGKAR